jgi:DNA polymerase-3 subunit alpha
MKWDFDIKSVSENVQYFCWKLERGLEKMGVDGIKEYIDRLVYEADVIIKMGFVDYFLILNDMMAYCEEAGIARGPGRGSSAGSLVCWLLGITFIDPVKHSLLFERFMNPERVSMPDADIDVDVHRRGEVIHYLMNRYGEDRIIGIMSFGTMGARAAIRDVSRALKIQDYVAVGDRIAKMVPMGEDDVDAALKGSQYLRDEQERLPRLFQMARNVIGKPRSASVHPAGIVIAPSDMSQLVPLYFGSRSAQRETSVCQWDMYDINDLGFLKVDILGLNTVTILDKAMKRLAANGVEFDLNAIPLDDRRSIAIFDDGETTGLFQLERKYVQELCRRMGVKNFLDVVYLNAIIRPGTADAGTIDHYIKRKRGEEEVEPVHSSLAEVLKDGYGYPIFQEDIMRIVQVFAGFTLGGADDLRRVVGKKQVEKMPKVERFFMEGALKMGHTEEEAKNVFSYIKTFAGYGFCRAHSACYALISYQGAYLKAHHPLEFMCELLNGEGRGSGDSQVGMYVDEARRMGIQVLPPSAVVGNAMFEIEGDKAIRFGLSFIKNVSASCVECLAPVARKKPLTFCEILRDVNMFKVNSKSMTNLIMAGAFDHMDKNRNRDCLLAKYNVAKAAVTKIKDQVKRESAGVRLRVKGDIGSAINEEMNVFGVPSCDLETTIGRELEVAEAYISHQPTAPWDNYFHNTATADVSDIADGFERKRKDLLVGGQARDVVDTVVKKGKNEGKRMVMFEMWHKYKGVRAVCFEEVLGTLRDPIVQGEVYLFKCDKWRGGSLIIKNAKRLSCEKDHEKPEPEEETQCHNEPVINLI